jgi:phage-related tail protein
MNWSADLAGLTDDEAGFVKELQTVAKKYGATALSFVGRIGKLDLTTDVDAYVAEAAKVAPDVAAAATEVASVVKDLPIPGATEVAAAATDIAAAATDVPAFVAESESFGEKVVDELKTVEQDVETALHLGGAPPA